MNFMVFGALEPCYMFMSHEELIPAKFIVNAIEWHCVSFESELN